MLTRHIYGCKIAIDSFLLVIGLLVMIGESSATRCYAPEGWTVDNFWRICFQSLCGGDESEYNYEDDVLILDS